MALVGNILLGTGAAPGMSSIASAYADSAASSRIPWSALEYSGQTITAISGSAIGGQGGGGDTSQCMPISGMTAYQTVSSISSWTADLSSISSKQDALTFGYSGEYISSINGSAIIDTQGGGGGGVTPEEVSAIASSYADEKLDKTASSTFAPSGDYAYASSLSSYLPGSASSNFAPSGDYALNSSLSGKLDNSASSTWYPKTGNPSGFLTAHQSLTAYQDRSSISAWTGDMSSISAKLDQSAFTSYSSTVNNNITSIENNITALSSVVSGKADASAVHEYSGVSPIVVDNTVDTISLSASSIYFDSSMMSYVSGGSGFVGVNSAGMQPAGDYAYRSSLSMYAYNSALSSKLDNSASGTWYPLTGNPSGFVTTSYTPTFAYNADDEISSIDGSAIAGGCTYTSPSGTVAIDNANGTLEIWNSAIAVTEHVTAGQSSFLGSSDSIWTNIYRSGVGKPAIPAGTNILYMVQFLQPLNYPDSAYSLEIRFTGDGAQTSVVSATDVHFPSAGGYTGSAMFSSDMNISALNFNINASESWYPTASATVSASSIVYPQTAYETSVQELALASQVPSMSAWQSLTAWATAQGWTP